MEQKTFTEKLVSVLVSGGMPTPGSQNSKESGLVVALADNATPVIACYGNPKPLAVALAKVMEQHDGLRWLLGGAVGAFMVQHPESEITESILEHIK